MNWACGCQSMPASASEQQVIAGCQTPNMRRSGLTFGVSADFLAHCTAGTKAGHSVTAIRRSIQFLFPSDTSLPFPKRYVAPYFQAIRRSLQFLSKRYVAPFSQAIRRSLLPSDTSLPFFQMDSKVSASPLPPGDPPQGERPFIPTSRCRHSIRGGPRCAQHVSLSPAGTQLSVSCQLVSFL